jgi:hypothetical protein
MDTGVNGDRPLNRGEAPAHAGPSMMASRHRAEAERINAENQKLLKRITQARAEITHAHHIITRIRRTTRTHRADGLACYPSPRVRARPALIARSPRPAAPQTATRRSEFSPETLEKDFKAHENNLNRISRFPPPK